LKFRYVPASRAIMLDEQREIKPKGY